MSEEKVTPPAELTKEQAEAVGGGGTAECIATNLNSVTSQLIKSYEDVVDFTSHVMTRVSGK